MANNSLSLAPGVVIEELGEDLMVMTPGSPTVVTLSGNSAAVLRTVLEGKQPQFDDAVRELVSLEILQHTPGISRRGLVKAGSIGALSTVAVLSMPSVAAASSAAEIVPGVIYQFGTPSTVYMDITVPNFTSDSLEGTGRLTAGQLDYDGSSYDVILSSSSNSGSDFVLYFATVTAQITLQAGVSFFLPFTIDSTRYVGTGITP